MQCTVAVSGGSDSLYALLYLREEGWNVHALHALFLPSATAGGAARDLADLCAGLGIPFETLDLSKAFFRSVMEPFAMEHARARTPNPCALCNRAMKFGLLLEHALQDGGMYATGHFASMQEHPVYGMTLRAAAYAPKDQSYFLSLVPIEKLRRCIFPLAGISKPDARAWLARRGYSVPLPSESQEICFIPGDNHCAWLEQWQRKRMINLPGPGPVLLARTGQVIARHSGLWRYTEGQRRGLGIAWANPLYVIARRRKENALVVGSKTDLAADRCSAAETNIMVPRKKWPCNVFVRVRYRHAPVPADVELDGDRMLIRFWQPQEPPAPGQIAAVYDGDGYVLAGGVLE